MTSQMRTGGHAECCQQYTSQANEVCLVKVFGTSQSPASFLLNIIPIEKMLEYETK